MGGAWRIGRFYGIPIRIHFTWFIIFLLIVVSLVANAWPGSGGYPLWERIVAAVLTSLLFFVSIVIHELVHSIIAVRNGIPVKDITLFVFGGVSQITREANKPDVELFMAIMGPVSSFILGGAFFGVAFLLGLGGYELAKYFAWWLFVINIALGIFNLIPGFPLDGGRVLRAIIWMFSGNYGRATNIASIIGRIVAYLFIFGGVVLIFTQNWFNGLWLAFIGWFLESAASSTQRQNMLREALRGYAVREVMTADCASVPPDMSVGKLVHEHVMPTGRRCALVLDRENLLGMVTLSDIKMASRETWDVTRVADIMTPMSRVKSVSPKEDALTLFEQMDQHNINQMPVVERGKVIGMVARENLIRFLRTKAELGM